MTAMTDLSPERLREVAKLAEEATPGPWRAHDHNGMAEVGEDPADWLGYAWVGWGGEPDGRFQGVLVDLNRRKDGSPEFREAAQHDAAFIAATDPAFVLGLIGECERLRKALEPFAKLLDEIEQRGYVGDQQPHDLPDSFPLLKKLSAPTLGHLRTARAALTPPAAP